MKAVDFIVELADRIYFIELKDPEDPEATAERRQEFIKNLQSGALDANLKLKFRDSFLYEWASGRVDKPIHYLVLIGLTSLTSAELLVRTDALRKQLPLLGPQGTPWHRPLAAGCAVLNIAAWNRALSTMPVRRVSL
ncbi:MAG: hypothetical protein ACK59M_18250 [Pseudomonadota bacterium]